MLKGKADTVTSRNHKDKSNKKKFINEPEGSDDSGITILRNLPGHPFSDLPEGFGLTLSCEFRTRKIQYKKGYKFAILEYILIEPYGYAFQDELVVLRN